MRRTVSIVLSLSVLATLVGCGAEEEASPSRFDSVDALRTAYVDAGGSCDNWEIGDAVGSWAQYGICGNNDATLSTYTTDDDLQEAVDGAKSSGGRTEDYELLVGENWMIAAADADAVQSELGGTLVTIGYGD